MSDFEGMWRATLAENLDLREQVSALESREVCTVAHDNVAECGYCQRDRLKDELHVVRTALGELLDEIDNLDGIEFSKDTDEYKAEAIWDFAITFARNAYAGPPSSAGEQQ